MALKEFRPLTPTQRFKALPGFDSITKSRPEKSLLEPKKKSGGRNNYGRITSRHIGGGHKHKYRKVDFKRRKHGVAAEVIGIEYDPNRSARIALIKYADGELSYILAPKGLVRQVSFYVFLTPCRTPAPKRIVGLDAQGRVVALAGTFPQRRARLAC